MLDFMVMHWQTHSPNRCNLSFVQIPIPLDPVIAKIKYPAANWR